ncbi:long-chain acyl-CoA synthetase [Geothermobacter ehrlichii]|uniref:Long-chain acyl-CoA synthetase n=1 Tax=Geothermobacter ehrlichii TaxID=213224 RepID=A0A5D3WMT4_9BACT|nr:AMP-binding protein [Geothermobacter ehrlichii]TYO98890.1 long-chain acyl-CoA synthetase [Geothermobacter ehrlichii]
MPQTFRYETLFHVFLNTCEKHADRAAFIYRADGQEFQVSYRKFFEDVLLLTRAFAEKHIRKGTRVLLLSDNRYGWIVTDMALMALGAVSVPRGSEVPSQELDFIMRHSGCEFLICETDELLKKHQEVIDQLPDLKIRFIIASEKRHKFLRPVYAYQDLLEDRTITDEDVAWFKGLADQLGRDDLVTLVYTSGTTGTPKGVQLLHRNLLYQVEELPKLINLTHEDRWLSILPTWHIFERAVEYIAIAAGSCTVYSSLKTFSDDLTRYRPTLVASVPRLWESLYTKVNNALEKQSPSKARLFLGLVAVSARYRRCARELRGHLPRFAPVPLPVRIWRKLAALGNCALLWPLYRLAQRKLSLVQEKFGGRLRIAISGGGALPPYLDQWLDAIGIRIANAYGMTECAPGIAGRGLHCEIFGTLGPPFPGTEIRIVDEDGNEVPPGREGEVQVRGPQVMPGYYNNDEENRKSFTEDGFFNTGDLGKLTLGGELVLTGRSKEIIVLASGENIDPTNIEATITMLPFVSDAVLVGQDQKGLGALIVPDREKLKEFVASKISKVLSETEDFLHDKRVVERIRQEINRLLQPKRGFKPYEKLRNISFLEDEFKVGEELTNTLKKKRHVIERKYQDLVKRLLK